jgi:hypothetical protein
MQWLRPGQTSAAAASLTDAAVSLWHIQLRPYDNSNDKTVELSRPYPKTA